MKYTTVTPELCAQLARDEFGTGNYNKNKTTTALDEEICSSLIGTTYIVASEIWNLIDPSNKEELKNAHPKHLFWALLFLKTYATEQVLIRVIGGSSSDRSYRKWTWLFVDEISNLKPRVINLQNQFRGWNGRNICLMSVDGVDCPVMEPSPFNTGIYSQKLNGPGLKYEIGICIETGDIVWVNGPFDAGRHDKTIFVEDGLKDALCDDECVEVDSGYQGDNKLKTPCIGETQRDRKQKSKVRARHENINGRLKKFGVLDNVFRHTRDMKNKHAKCFNAVAVITQLSFEFGEHLYSVEYDVQYN